MAPRRKTSKERAAENRLFRDRDRAVGVMAATVRIPADRLSELREIALEWRREARLLLEGDLPSADQILQIHAISRALGLNLPVEAFETRAAATDWLYAHEKKLGPRRAHIPRFQGAGL